jgi:hypothetical protein
VSWGVGHSLTLLAVGGLCLLLDWTIPERIAAGLEAAVGAMLLLLGASVLWRLRRAGFTWRAHSHGDGVRHLHAQRGAGPHEHRALTLRALGVGVVHGLGGSAGLLLLALPALGTPMQALAYIAIFGVGSILGMAALSLVVARPLGGLAALPRVQAAVGWATVGLGGWIVWKMAPLAL